MSGIRRPKPEPAVPELAADSSGPMNLRVNADGTVQNPPFYNSIWSEDSTPLFGSAIAVVSFSPVFNNVGNAHLVLTSSANFRITATGVMQLRLVLQNPVGVNLLDKTFSAFDANPVSAVAPPANGGMNQVGQVGSSAIPISSIVAGNWTILAIPIVSSGAGTVHSIGFSRIEAIG